MKVTQHIPGFCSGLVAYTAEVDTKDELLKLDWIKRWAEEPFDGVPFLRFSLGDNYLMGEWGEGKISKWWVIAYLEKPEEIDLPEIEYPKLVKKDE